jgi:hypothetical protein
VLTFLLNDKEHWIEQEKRIRECYQKLQEEEEIRDNFDLDEIQEWQKNTLNIGTTTPQRD